MIELFLPDYPADVEELLQEHVEEIHQEPEYYYLPDDGHEHVWIQLSQDGEFWDECVLCGRK